MTTTEEEDLSFEALTFGVSERDRDKRKQTEREHENEELEEENYPTLEEKNVILVYTSYGGKIQPSQIINFAQSAGKIVNYNFRDKQCFGFLQFEDESSVDRFLESLTSTLVDGIQLSGERCNGITPGRDPRTHNSNSDYKNSTLVLKNLPFQLKQEKLEEILASVQVKPLNVSYLYDNNGMFRGMAFVKYKEIGHGTKVFETLNGMDINGRKLRIEYKRKVKEASVLQEDDVNHLHEQLIQFTTSTLTELSFPCVSSYQRRQIHQFAERLGLGHYSTGEGDSRFVLVKKRELENNLLPSSISSSGSQVGSVGMGTSTNGMIGSYGSPSMSSLPSVASNSMISVSPKGQFISQKGRWKGNELSTPKGSWTDPGISTNSSSTPQMNSSLGSMEGGTGGYRGEQGGNRGNNVNNSGSNSGNNMQGRSPSDYSIPSNSFDRKNNNFNSNGNNRSSYTNSFGNSSLYPNNNNGHSASSPYYYNQNSNENVYFNNSNNHLNNSSPFPNSFPSQSSHSLSNPQERMENRGSTSSPNFLNERNERIFNNHPNSFSDRNFQPNNPNSSATSTFPINNSHIQQQQGQHSGLASSANGGLFPSPHGGMNNYSRGELNYQNSNLFANGGFHSNNISSASSASTPPGFNSFGGVSPASQGFYSQHPQYNNSFSNYSNPNNTNLLPQSSFNNSWSQSSNSFGSSPPYRKSFVGGRSSPTISSSSYDPNSNEISAVRQPKGPDGTMGFSSDYQRSRSNSKENKEIHKQVGMLSLNDSSSSSHNESGLSSSWTLFGSNSPLISVSTKPSLDPTYNPPVSSNPRPNPSPIGSPYTARHQQR